MDRYEVYRRRDLTITRIDSDKYLVTACDSCGGIGEKAQDVLYAPNAVVGAYTARVAIMEVMSAGASIISVSNAVCCEITPTGFAIIEGVKGEMKRAGISNAALGGSTEENFKTGMTAVGISVTGVAEREKLKFRACASGDLIILLGRPLVGGELLEDGGKSTASYEDISLLLCNDDVREIVPVGSKGILYEASQLASLNGLSFFGSSSGVDLIKSAGPATCVIAAVSSGWKPDITDYTVIGTLTEHLL